MAQTISNLSVGSKVKFGKYQVASETPAPIVWTVVSKNTSTYSGYPSNVVVLHSTYLLDMLPYDAEEPNNPNTYYQWYGNPNYNISNIHTWLNSTASAGNWYSSQHNYDAPPAARFLNRPGFLYNFTSTERSLIKQGSSPLDKVFIPTVADIGNTGSNSDYNVVGRWGYYTTNASRLTTATSNCVNYCTSSYKPTSTTQNFSYNSSSTVSFGDGAGKYIWRYDTYDSSYTGLIANEASAGDMGVRPALCVDKNAIVSNTTDSDGCYTLVTNLAPSAPSFIDLPENIVGGKSFTVTWGPATDTDGTIAKYQLYRRYKAIGSSSWISWPSTPVYEGTALTYTTSDRTTGGSNDWDECQYRVRAVDDKGATSAYTTSEQRTVSHGSAPVISGSDGSLGTKTAAFSLTYTVTDTDASDVVTVVEAIDTNQLRTYTVVLGDTNTFSVTGETWLKLQNGSHTLTITATDAFGSSTTRTYSFTKSVTSFTIQNASPISSSTMPTRIKMYVTRNIPTGATCVVSVCNNGYDASPTWEEILNGTVNYVDSNEPYEFTNDTKTAANWGVGIKVEVNRGTATGECFVSQIGGNFDSN